MPWTCRELHSPKAPCTYIVDTYALKGSLYRYFKANVYTIWVHGALGFVGVKPWAFRVKVRKGRWGLRVLKKGGRVQGRG